LARSVARCHATVRADAQNRLLPGEAFADLDKSSQSVIRLDVLDMDAAPRKEPEHNQPYRSRYRDPHKDAGSSCHPSVCSPERDSMILETPKSRNRRLVLGVPSS
jgi:hypothetical protein